MRLYRACLQALEESEQIPIRVRHRELAVSDFARVASIPVFFQRQLDDSASRDETRVQRIDVIDLDLKFTPRPKGCSSRAE